MKIDFAGFLAKVKSGSRKVISSVIAFFGTALGAEFAVIVTYGFIINLVLNALLNYSFNAWTGIAWGLVYYFVAYDLPQVVDKYRKALSK